jgi:hypothetical protein
MKNKSNARIIEIGFRKYEGVNVGGYGENKWENGTSVRNYKKMCRLKKKWNLKKKDYIKYCEKLEYTKLLFKKREENGYFSTHHLGYYYESSLPKLCTWENSYTSIHSMCRICENVSMSLK